MQRQMLSESELMTALNEAFASHEQSAGAKVDILECIAEAKSDCCNWRCAHIDHGGNIPQQYETLRANIIKQHQDAFNLRH